MAQAARKVVANLRRLGFRPSDVRWIVSSHEHFDHVGALAALQQRTGARVAALPAAAGVLSSGRPDPADPQREGLERQPLAPVGIDRLLTDGEPLVLGDLGLTPHATPAHSPGSTSWTWESCEGDRCVTMTYADSASTISDDGYRFLDHPDRVAEVRRGLETIRALPCGGLITPHPSASALFERLESGALEEPGACRAYADAARFEARFADEAAHRVQGP